MSSPSTSKDSKADPISKKSNEVKDTQSQALPPTTSLTVDVELELLVEEEKGTSEGVITETETTKPLPVPKDASKGGAASHDIEIVLVAIPLLAKEDPKGKGPTSTAAEVPKPTKGIGTVNPPLKIN